MDKIKKLLPAILLILFELAVGVLLLINPERFTITVFIIFGAVLIVCALVMLIRYLKERKAAEKAAAEQKDGDQKASPEGQKAGVLPLIAAIVTFIFGAVFAFGAPALYTLTLLLVIFYGAIMIIKGVFKIADYVSLRKEKAGVSTLRLVVGILSIAVGIVMIVFSHGAREAMFIIAAISLLAEAVLDIATLVLGYRVSKELASEVKEVEDDDPYHLENFAE